MAEIRCRLSDTVRWEDAQEFVECYPAATMVSFREADKNPAEAVFAVPDASADEFIQFCRDDVIVVAAERCS